MGIFGIAITWFLFAVVIAVGAASRGRNGFGWFLVAMVISPLLAGILLAFMPSLHQNQAQDQRKCPFCAEMIKREAVKCYYCGSVSEPILTPVTRKMSPAIIGVLLLIGVPAAIIFVNAFMSYKTNPHVPTEAIATAAENQPIAPAPIAACGTDNISLDKVTDHSEGPWMYITGQLTNHCSVPIGVEVKVTTYDANDNILSVDDMWPASIKNIPPSTDFPFQTMMDKRKREGIAKYELRVIDVKDWDK